MIKITKEFNGNVMMIDLNEEDVRYIISECAVIGLRTDAQPAAKPETKNFTMPKTTHVGRMIDHQQEVKTMLEQDYSYGKIAEYFGVSLSTVNKYIRMWGFSRPSASRFHPTGMTLADGKAMLKAHRNGMSFKTIAEARGIKPEVVAYWVNKAIGAEAA